MKFLGLFVLSEGRSPYCAAWGSTEGVPVCKTVIPSASLAIRRRRLTELGLDATVHVMESADAFRELGAIDGGDWSHPDFDAYGVRKIS